MKGRESLSHKISFNHSTRLTFAYTLFILPTYYSKSINYLSKIIFFRKKTYCNHEHYTFVIVDKPLHFNNLLFMEQHFCCNFSKLYVQILLNKKCTLTYFSFRYKINHISVPNYVDYTRLAFTKYIILAAIHHIQVSIYHCP
jgi:hypothetical protein